MGEDEPHEYMMLRGIFQPVYPKGMLTDHLPQGIVLGRWCKRRGITDATKAETLVWEKAPARYRRAIGLAGAPHFHFIDVKSILESVVVIPKPFSASQRGGADNGDIFMDGRRMWVHAYGRSARGE